MSISKKILLMVLIALSFFTFDPALTFLSNVLCPMREVIPEDVFPVNQQSFVFKSAKAVPAFARKYGVSCLKCHTAYPQLTPFGKGFKKNGLRFPGEGVVFESEAIKIGDSHGRVPSSTIPTHVPFSIAVLSQLVSKPRDTSFNKQFQFQHLFGQANIIAAGNMGKYFSLWVGISVSGSANLNVGSTTASIAIERVYAVIRPFDQPYLLLRIGSFEPTLLNISDHQSIIGSYFLTSAHTVGNNGFTLEPNQSGIEASGILAKRFAYSLGVVEGNGNRFNKEKDVYARVEYKFGGLWLTGEETQTSKTIGNPWRDDSITIGFFGYLGFATVASALAFQQDTFGLFGMDLDINFVNFLLKMGYVGHYNKRPLLINPNRSVFTNHLYAEIEYIYYWFIPAFRYEYFSSFSGTDHRITLATIFLLAPNIRTFIRATLVSLNNTGIFKDPEFRAGISMAF